MKHLLRLGIPIALLLSMATSQGAIIVSWDLTDDLGTQTTESPNFAAANITGLDMTRGSGIGGSGAGSSFSSSGWDGTAGTPASDTEYMSFGFTVADGFTVDLDNLIITTRSSGTGPGTLGLYYSGDGFTTPLTTFVQSGTAFLNSSVSLSSLTGLTGVVEFRIIEIGNTSASGSGNTGSGGTFRIAENGVDVQFNGSVAVVPEPTGAVLLGIAGLGLTLIRRRRRIA